MDYITRRAHYTAGLAMISYFTQAVLSFIALIIVTRAEL